MPKKKLKKTITKKTKDGKVIQTVNVYTGRRGSSKKPTSTPVRQVSTTDLLLSSLLSQNKNYYKQSEIYNPSSLTMFSQLPKKHLFSTTETQTEKPKMVSFETQTERKPIVYSSTEVDYDTQFIKPQKSQLDNLDYFEPPKSVLRPDEEIIKTTSKKSGGLFDYFKVVDALPEMPEGDTIETIPVMKPLRKEKSLRGEPRIPRDIIERFRNEYSNVGGLGKLSLKKSRQAIIDWMSETDSNLDDFLAYVLDIPESERESIGQVFFTYVNMNRPTLQLEEEELPEEGVIPQYA